MNLSHLNLDLLQHKERALFVKNFSGRGKVEANCLTSLVLDLQVDQDQLSLLERISTAQSRLSKANSMLIALRSQLTSSSRGAHDQENYDPETFGITVDENQKRFLNAVFQENSAQSKLITGKVTINDLAYLTGQVEGWIGGGDMKIQDLQAQAQFISKQYNGQLQLIDKLMNSTYDIFLNAIKQIS